VGTLLEGRSSPHARVRKNEGNYAKTHCGKRDGVKTHWGPQNFQNPNGPSTGNCRIRLKHQVGRQVGTSSWKKKIKKTPPERCPGADFLKPRVSVQNQRTPIQGPVHTPPLRSETALHRKIKTTRALGGGESAMAGSDKLIGLVEG